MASPAPPPRAGKLAGAAALIGCFARLVLTGAIIMACCAEPSDAARIYQGIYLETNPYSNANNPSDLQLLATGAATPCDGTPSLFCTAPPPPGSQISAGPAISGILLQIPWCGWETDGGPNSCFEFVDNTGTPVPISIAGNTSPCAAQGYMYDSCVPGNTTHLTCPLTSGPPTGAGILGQALYFMCQINKRRGAAQPKLDSLRLSVALEAGIATPLNVQNTIAADGGPATIDVPLQTTKPGGGSSIDACGRLPLVWYGNYTADYSTAFTALLGYIGPVDNYPGNPLLTVAKIGGLNTDSAEVVLSGTGFIPGTLNGHAAIQWTAQPATGQNAPPAGTAPLDCTYLNGGVTAAQEWLNIYNMRGYANVPFAQEIENVLGTLTGYEEGAMVAQSGATPSSVSPNFLLSMPIRNSEAFPDVTCGLQAAQTTSCAVDDPYITGNQWSTYYFSYAVLGLTNTTVGSGKNAQRAYSGFSSTFSVTGLALNATNLMPVPSQIAQPGPGPGPTPIPYPLTSPGTTPVSTNCTPSNTECLSLAQNDIPCILNNTNANQISTLQTANNNGVLTNTPILGIGTLLGWQTAPSDENNNQCVSPGQNLPSQYDKVLALGTNNGAEYLEVSPKEAGDRNCQISLSTALPTVLAAPLNATCAYSTQ